MTGLAPAFFGSTGRRLGSFDLTPEGLSEIRRPRRTPVRLLTLLAVGALGGMRSVHEEDDA